MTYSTGSLQQTRNTNINSLFKQILIMRQIFTISTQAIRGAVYDCRRLSRPGLMTMLIALLSFGFSFNADAQCSNMTLNATPPSWNGSEQCSGYDPTAILAPVINYTGTCLFSPVYDYQWQRQINGGGFTTITSGSGVLSVPGFNPGAESNSPGNPMQNTQWRLLVQDLANGLSAQSGNFTVFIVSNVVITCPSDASVGACATSSDISNSFGSWINSFTYSGGSSSTVTGGLTGSPASACGAGGVTSITYTVTDGCSSDNCTRTFTVPAGDGTAPSINTCAVTRNINGCSTNDITGPAYSTSVTASSESEFENATNQGDVSDNCTITSVTYQDNASGTCPIVVTRTWTFTDYCGNTSTCNQTINVNAPPVNVTNVPANTSAAVCLGQAAIDATYASWIAGFSYTGGCSSALVVNDPGAPSACGGTSTVTWTINSDCEAPVVNTRTFTVIAPDPIVLNAPANDGVGSCGAQAAVDAIFNSWVNSFSFTGGCNPVLSVNNPGAPNFCGGSTTVTWTVNSDCGSVSESRTFTVDFAPQLIVNCPAPATEAACQTQAAIDAAYSAWLGSFATQWGCQPNATNNSTGAPSACGGSTTVTWTVTSNCEAPVTCSSTFNVTAAPTMALNAPTNATEAACQTQLAVDAAFASWLASANVTGGCNSSLTNDATTAPSACGGVATVTFTATSDCQAPIVETRTFTVSNAPAVVFNCGTDVDVPVGTNQAAVDVLFANFVASASASGGCGGSLSNNASLTAPDACSGDTITVTWTYSSNCDQPYTCTKEFRVPGGIVRNVNTGAHYCTLNAAISAATAGDGIELLGNHTEGIVNVNKVIALDGNTFTLTSTSASYGLAITSPNVSVSDMTITAAGTFGIHTGCGSDNLLLTNVTTNNNGGTGIALNGTDNAVLTNITSTNNTGNGLSLTNCDNTTINGITTSGNAFGGGFSAGIGIFTTEAYCLPSGVNGVTLNGANLGEPVGAYSQKTNGAQIITGLNGAQFAWAAGIGVTDRYYYTTKAGAYATVDALFEAPFNVPNSAVYVVEVATENFWVNDDPNGDNTPPMSIQAAVNLQAAGGTIFVEDGTYAENVNVNKAVILNGANANTACGSRGAESIISVASGVPVTITADGVTVNGFEMTGANSPYAVNLSNTSNTTVNYNNIHDIGASVAGQNVHAIIYSVGSGNYSNVAVNDNCLNAIAGSGLTGFSASAIGFLQSTSTGVLTDVSIQRNTINNVAVNNANWPTGKIAYGIQLNTGGGSGYMTTTGKIVNAQIRQNEISNLSGHIATGIGLEGNTENAAVTNNSISNLAGTKDNTGLRSSGGFDVNGLKFENNRFVSTCTVENNSFQTNTYSSDGVSNLGYAVANYVPVANGGAATLGCNWYGTAVYNAIEDNATLTGKIFNKDNCQTTFVPYLVNGADQSATIGFQPDPLACTGTPVVLSATFAMPSCNGGNNGSIDLTISGGTSPYTILWSNSETTEDISGLSAGTYSVLVTDANGSTSTTEVIVTDPSVITLSGGSNPVSCFGGNNGSVGVYPSGGTPIIQSGTYNYTPVAPNDFGYSAQSGTNTFSYTFANAGTYTIGMGVVDGGDNVVNSGLLVDDLQINGISDEGFEAGFTGWSTIGNTYIENSFVGIAPTEGTQQAHLSTGVPFSSTPAAPVGAIESFLGVASGAIDAMGGSFTPTTEGSAITRTITVNAGDVVSFDWTFLTGEFIGSNFDKSFVSITGNGLQLLANTQNGIIPGAEYTYSWSPNIGTTNEVLNVSAGTYTVLVTDANGCTATTSITVTEPTALVATAVENSPIPCVGGTTTVTVTASGGTAPYLNEGTFTVSAGTYTYTVSDDNGCTATTTITVNDPAPVVVTVTETTPVACFGGNAVVTVTASGGTAPYVGTGTYTVSAGTHYYNVTDANNCNGVGEITVDEPSLLVSSVSQNAAIACNGGTTTVTVSATGGTMPYTGASTFTVSAGTYTYTVTDANGCTSSTSITITEPTAVAATVTVTQNITCFGLGNGIANVSVSGGTPWVPSIGHPNPYDYSWSTGGTGFLETLIDPGTHTVTVTDSLGCIGIAVFTMTEPPLLVATATKVSDPLCFGQSNGHAFVTIAGGTPFPLNTYNILWSTGGTFVNEFIMPNGTHTVTVTDANGCVATSTVTMVAPAQLVATASATPIICNGGQSVVTVSAAGGTAPFNGTGTFTVSAGTYTYSVVDANGCSASTSITVTQPAVITQSSSATACDSYTWTNNATYTTSGVYAATFTAANGCDSIHTLTLTVNYSSSSSVTVTACDAYTWTENGATYTTSGVYTNTSLNQVGCVNTATLNLTVNYSTSSSATETVCDTYTWAENGATYTQSGTYVHTSLNQAGCVNTATLNLTVNYSTSTNATVIGCDMYTWAENGATYTTSGMYVHTSLNQAGCLNTATLNLTINYSTTSSATETVCDTYTWAENGATYTQSGTYVHTSLNQFGCLNTATLNLTVNYSTSSSATETVCDTYTWAENGATYTQSGTYVHTSLNQAGCVNTATLNLTVNYSTSTNATVIGCDMYTWAENGATYTTSGMYVHTSLNQAGCLNTATLNLTINYSTTSSATETVCDTYTWAENGATYTQSGTYVHTSLNQFGCLNTATLNLTVNYSTSSSATETVCDTYTWAENGATYTQSGTYVHTSTNPAGCVNTATLNLTVNYSTSTNATLTECDMYTWAENGATYTTSGVYVHTSLNQFGCLNTATLNLTVNYSSATSTTETACDSYTWAENGVTYANSGTYIHTSTNPAGCVNTATLNLTINYSTTNTTTVSACDSYTWAENGVTYTASATATATSVNQAGCTHTETLVLTVNYSTTSSSTITAQVSYTWPANGQTYTASGIYTATYLNINGCPNTETLDLTILGVALANSRVFLDGPYDALSQTMHDSLRVQNNGRIPTQEPYSSFPFNRIPVNDPNGKFIAPGVLDIAGPTAIVDWVLLELRSTIAPYPTLYTRRALVRRDGSIVDTNGTSPVLFASAPAGDYRVSVRHRNHLAVMTASSVNLTLAGTAVDFATTPLFVNPAITVNTPARIVGGMQVLWAGDANANKSVRYNGFLNDKQSVLNAVGIATPNNIIYDAYRVEDVNMDGQIKYNNFNADRLTILATVGVSTPNATYSQHTPD
jgi:hypothetical protein